MLHVTLTPAEKDILFLDINGQGGFQSMLLKFREQLSGNILTLYEEDIKRFKAYTSSYGQGGYQGRLLKLTSVINAINNR